MRDKRPWDVNPALDEASLRALGLRVLQIRESAFAQHDPSQGDGPWSLGCRAYERTVNVLEQDARGNRFPFLSVKRYAPLDFAMLVNGTPIRLYRGEPENPPMKHLEAAVWEQMQLFSARTRASAPDEAWMAAVQTDAEGRGVAVTFFLGDFDSHQRHLFTVEATDLAKVTPLTRPGVDLGPPVVEPKSAPAQNEKSEDAGR